MSAVFLHASVQEEILALKRERKAIILAHHYQESEIQELADVIGDSLELARKAKQFDGEVIVFCGVWFMAETAKLLNPERIVVVPEAKAGCSLVDSCPVEQLRAFKQRHPDHVVVSYINTSAAVKAESDIICTSRNAVQVVNSIPAEKPVLFCPDINLGNYVKQQTGRGNMRIWQGACIVHATFAARRLTATKMEHPGALVAAHPECPAEVLAMADYIGSTSAIIEHCVKSEAGEWIIMTESGVRHSLEKGAPGKKFYFVANENCNCSECPFMRMNTLEKLRDCLEGLAPRVTLPVGMMERARLPIERMLAL
ncbi:MAG: quinolinate synthase NadA [Bryobacter sp.]|jgi:quinolinate synthase|nr:quinolinate synthase NadA [Bryobacter sp. CoA8 C33]